MSSENFSLKPVPYNERKGAIALTFVMFRFNILFSEYVDRGNIRDIVNL